LFVDVLQRPAGSGGGAPVFWRGRASRAALQQVAGRFLGAPAAQRMFADYAERSGAGRVERIVADAQLVQYVETQLAGAIGSASARAVVSAVVEEEPLAPDDVLRLLDEASQVRALNRQLESVDRLKDDFMSSVTHELRTPLTSIRAFAELMRDDPDMDSGQRQLFVGLIVAEAERLSRLVSQVLDMAKIESGHADWRNDAIDLCELVGHAVQTTRESFRERGAQVDVEQPDSVPVLHADRDRLLQVLLNLLSNAAKFVPKVGGRVTVALRADARGATIEVSDNGPGVPAGQQQLVFEKFRQGGDGGNRPQGTGLGLPISRQIVEHFGGRMWLRSEAGQGACFGVELPWHHEETTA
jgi:signal transduction histidine kinase